MFAFLAVMLTSSLDAQQRLNGSITGLVTDAENNPLPGVSVTLTGPALQGKIVFLTTETGTFRFPAVPPGDDYTLTLELAGFKHKIWKGLSVSVGKVTNVNIPMELSALEEEVTVTGVSPTVDVKASKTAVNYSKEFISNIPLRRDLYDVLNSIPGSVSEGVTYRRTSYIAGGTVRGNQYSVDGVSINDPVVMYPMTNVNVDVYEEVEFGLFGHSAEVGIADGGFVNIVTKSGGNAFHGGATVEYYNEDMQISLLSKEDLKAVGQTKPAGWNMWQDVSVYLGGPIIKDKIWFFSNGRYFKWQQDFSHIIWDDTIAAGKRVYTLDQAPHNEWDIFGKLTFQLASNIRLMATYNLAMITEKFYTNRVDNYLDVTATTKWDGEKGHTISGQLNWVLSQNFFIDARVGYIRRWFPIPYSEFAIKDAPRYYDRYWGIYKNNPRFEETYLRKRLNPSITATLFQDNLLGASHEIKIGAEFESTYGDWDWWRANPWIVYFYNGDIYSYKTSSYPNRGRLYVYTAGNTQGSTTEKETMTRFGVFLQDSVTIANRLTLNLGVRFDTSQGRIPEQHHSAVTDPFGLVPTLKGSSDSWEDYTLPKMNVLRWTHFSPRLGASYDLFGDGKTSLKASWSRYNEYLMQQYFSLANPMYPNQGSWEWYDTDYDRVIEPTDKFVLRYLPPGAFDFDIENEINTKATAPYTDEFTVGLEHELAKDLSVGVSFIYKHKQNIFEDVNDYSLGREEAWKGYSIDSPYWEKFEFLDPGDDGLFGTSDDRTSYCYAELANAPATHYYLTNVEGGFRKYMGLNFIVNKRMSNRWQMLASVVWSKAWGNIGGNYDASYGASGGFDTPNAFVYAEGRLDYDRPLNIKIQSTVILPYDFILSAYFNFLSGSPWARSITVYIPNDPKYKYPATTYGVNTEESGTRRNPSVSTLDLRIEKRFKVGERFSIGGYLDILNALGRSGYNVSSNPGGYLDYSNPAKPTFTRYGNFGTITGAYGNRVFKVSLRFMF
jgi:outer membrane receptor protein involved in Fe transport